MSIKFPDRVVGTLTHNDIEIFVPKFKEEKLFWPHLEVQGGMRRYALRFICLFDDHIWLRNYSDG